MTHSGGLDMHSLSSDFVAKTSMELTYLYYVFPEVIEGENNPIIFKSRCEDTIITVGKQDKKRVLLSYSSLCSYYLNLSLCST
ncbi:hypothetical protein Y1Q_0007932 [Alligator mississippiensis]|uniref:Uncharacterized protein n=1 Tax=Alligator mississippiensis TaxID=8496 RepID=A0A151NEY9_ALLMI|nr:hypothetical protein Y1Q_0007932 [Alligator mississippiensis]